MAELKLQSLASELRLPTCTFCTYCLLDDNGELKCDKNRAHPDVTRTGCPDYRRNNKLIQILNEVWSKNHVHS